MDVNLDLAIGTVTGALLDPVLKTLGNPGDYRSLHRASRRN
jgi:hypothetical protein